MVKKNWLLGSLVLAAAGACSLANVPEDPLAPAGGGGTTTISTSSNSSSSSGGTGGSSCDPDQCSGIDKTCRYRACIDGECGFENAPEGTVCDEGGACDGEGKCVPASCGDDKKNGAETGLDCGGPCPPCPNDEGCVGPEDCQSGFCDDGTCHPCSTDDGSGQCGDGKFCDQESTCAPLKPNGQGCAGPIECTSGFCTDGVCCDSACDGVCVTCKAQPGACTPHPAGKDPDQECQSPKTCDGKGACACVGSKTYLLEDFSDPNGGWILGAPEWQIGKATASTGETSGTNPDPAVDHTADTIDPNNGVAGVVIGGNARTAVHPYEYLESAFFDTSIGPGPVTLSFWRWLNSDYAPFMQNVVQVFDGNTWVTLWESGPSPAVTDSQWTQQTFDITPYRSSKTRIRFGHTVLQDGAWTASSWNIDDVMVANCLP